MQRGVDGAEQQRQRAAAGAVRHDHADAAPVKVEPASDSAMNAVTCAALSTSSAPPRNAAGPAALPTARVRDHACASCAHLAGAGSGGQCGGPPGASMSEWILSPRQWLRSHRPPHALARRPGTGTPAAPVGQVHLGLGNFFRAHQAWYTEHSPDRDQWGIAAFTGRSSALADALASQDCLYTLVTRADEPAISSTSSAVCRLPTRQRSPELPALPGRAAVRVLTLTVTEAGYCLAAVTVAWTPGIPRWRRTWPRCEPGRPSRSSTAAPG